MNSGLPSLLDAIFGKKDLASVSLDELYEVINEFPSFNAAHFLLSRKLKEQNEAAYEKQSMRTALYFNNAFWLQSILEESNRINPEEITFSREEVKIEEETYRERLAEDEDSPLRESVTEIEVDEETSFSDPSAEIEQTQTSDYLKQENIPEQNIFTEASGEEITSFSDSSYEEPLHPENITGPVTSFDELISKYKIEQLKDELPAEIQNPAEEQPMDSSPLETISDPPPSVFKEEPVEVVSESPTMVHFEEILEPDRDSNVEQFETREEVVNEYGIFEEVIVKKPDYDLEAFDRPMDDRPLERISPIESLPIEIPAAELQQKENDNISEIEITEDISDKSDAGDYEAFDRPVENHEIDGYSQEASFPTDFTSESETREADDTENTEESGGNTDNESDGRMQNLADRFEEHQKSRIAFDTKKAESIVFAPYHMIDYFASQGIKLVLEDNPADNFGKQLKSFTDWLKVMKKLPAKPESGKNDDQEADRIRHFAAHSIEERDILTESMAEVLAKQGMYENAIALYQKLSLIYPPKSAYFASRIEQIKASLP